MIAPVCCTAQCSRASIQLDIAQPGVNCFAGIIYDEHVSDWLHQQGPFSLRKPTPEHNVVGGIRILICEQREGDPLTFPISRDSYLRVEKHFHLSPATLPYFKNGGYSHHWRHVTTGGRNELGNSPNTLCISTHECISMLSAVLHFTLHWLPNIFHPPVSCLS